MWRFHKQPELLWVLICSTKPSLWQQNTVFLAEDIITMTPWNCITELRANHRFHFVITWRCLIKNTADKACNLSITRVLPVCTAATHTGAWWEMLDGDRKEYANNTAFVFMLWCYILIALFSKNLRECCLLFDILGNIYIICVLKVQSAASYLSLAKTCKQPLSKCYKAHRLGL